MAPPKKSGITVYGPSGQRAGTFSQGKWSSGGNPYTGKGTAAFMAGRSAPQQGPTSQLMPGSPGNPFNVTFGGFEAAPAQQPWAPPRRAAVPQFPQPGAAFEPLPTQYASPAQPPNWGQVGQEMAFGMGGLFGGGGLQGLGRQQQQNEALARQVEEFNRQLSGVPQGPIGGTTQDIPSGLPGGYITDAQRNIWGTPQGLQAQSALRQQAMGMYGPGQPQQMGGLPQLESGLPLPPIRGLQTGMQGQGQVGVPEPSRSLGTRGPWRPSGRGLQDQHGRSLKENWWVGLSREEIARIRNKTAAGELTSAHKFAGYGDRFAEEYPDVQGTHEEFMREQQKPYMKERMKRALYPPDIFKQQQGPLGPYEPGETRPLKDLSRGSTKPTIDRFMEQEGITDRSRMGMDPDLQKQYMGEMKAWKGAQEPEAVVNKMADIQGGDNAKGRAILDRILQDIAALNKLFPKGLPGGLGLGGGRLGILRGDGDGKKAKDPAGDPADKKIIAKLKAQIQNDRKVMKDWARQQAANAKAFQDKIAKMIAGMGGGGGGGVSPDAQAKAEANWQEAMRLIEEAKRAFGDDPLLAAAEKELMDLISGATEFIDASTQAAQRTRLTDMLSRSFTQNLQIGQPVLAAHGLRGGAVSGLGIGLKGEYERNLSDALVQQGIAAAEANAAAKQRATAQGQQLAYQRQATRQPYEMAQIQALMNRAYPA